MNHNAAHVRKSTRTIHRNVFMLPHRRHLVEATTVSRFRRTILRACRHRKFAFHPSLYVSSKSRKEGGPESLPEGLENLLYEVYRASQRPRTEACLQTRRRPAHKWRKRIPSAAVSQAAGHKKSGRQESSCRSMRIRVFTCRDPTRISSMGTSSRALSA